MFNWLKQSNRLKHLGYAVSIGFILGLPTVLGVASALEYKDHAWGGEWDWLDWSATMLGGLIGQALSIPIWWLILK